MMEFANEKNHTQQIEDAQQAGQHLRLLETLHHLQEIP